MSGVSFRREVSGGAAAAACLGALTGAVLGLLLTAWLVMLVAGGLHHEVSDSIPAIGFGASVLVTLALSLLSGFLKGGSR